MSDTTEVLLMALLSLNLLGLVVVAVRLSFLDSDDRKLDRRLTQLEARVDNLPTHRDLGELRSDIAGVVESVAAIAGQTQTMTQMLRTIQEYLLENDR